VRLANLTYNIKHLLAQHWLHLHEPAAVVATFVGLCAFGAA
jgi:hypothetical protein